MASITADGPLSKRPPHIWLVPPVPDPVLDEVLLSVIKRTLLSWPKATLGIAAIIGIGAIVTIVAAVSSGTSPGGTAACDRGLGAPGRLTTHDAPCALPGGPASVSFADGQGRPLTLDDFRGKVVLVNLWATWCPPCIEEMPALDSLQARLGGDAFEVVAISQDRGGVSLPKAFLEREGLDNLTLYIDPDSATTRAIAAPGLPTSILLDRQGRELARLVGPAAWDDDAMVARIRELGGV